MSSDKTDRAPQSLVAAETLAERAWQVDDDDGPAAALPLYHELIDGAHDSASRTLLVWGLNAMSRAHEELGNLAESRAAALQVVDVHFDDAPADAVEPIVLATLRLAAFLEQDGSEEEAIALMRRLMDRYAQPGVPDHVLTAAVTRGNIGRILSDAGRREEARDEFRAVIAVLGDTNDPEAQALVTAPGEPEARWALADALAAEAEFLYADNRQDEGDTRLRDLVERFGSAGELKIKEVVAWARGTLDDSGRHREPRRMPWRR
jgi:tetratricopeptide (TPR) repeat protein